MSSLLKTIFLDNPELPHEIYRFCNSLPDYVQAQQAYLQAAGEVEQLLGPQRYLLYEDLLNRYIAAEERAFYLFGLQLRREVLAALGEGR